MKRAELYQRSVDILAKAYMDNTLEHNNCAACAVGNLVAANNGYEIIPNLKMSAVAQWCKPKGIGVDFFNPEWHKVFMTGGVHDVRTGNITRHQDRDPQAYRGEAAQQIDSTGYSWQELSQIEHAFEIAPKGSSEDEWMFNGLMAVVDVLDRIHENTDEAVTRKSKYLFESQLN